MAPKWLIGLIMVYVFSVAICIVLDMATGEMSVISKAMASLSSMDFSNPITGIMSVLTGFKAILVAMFHVMTWEYTFFYGYYAWIRWMLFAISLGIIMSLVTTWVRGSSSA